MKRTAHPLTVFLAASFCNRVGDWMDLAALGWITMVETGSAWQLGLIQALRLVPVFVLSYPAGWLADRHDRRRLLQVVQVVHVGLCLLLAACVARHGPFSLFAALVGLRACTAAMEAPIGAALVPLLARPEQRDRAVALHALQFNLARVAGSVLAGVLLANGQAVTLLVLNALSGAVLVAGLSAIGPLPRLGAAAGAPAPMADWLATAPEVPGLLLLSVAPMVFAFPLTGMLPYFAQARFGLGPSGLGWMLTVSALGALVGALGWVARPPARDYLWLGLCALGLAVALGGLALSERFAVVLAMLVLVGYLGQAYRTLSRIAIQRRAPESLRGRLLSLAMMDRGLIPLGSLLIGAVGSACGPRAALWTMGVGALVSTLLALGWGYRARAGRARVRSSPG